MKQKNEQNTEFPIKFSENAIKMAELALIKIKDNNFFLRISIKGGGCAGFKYILNFVNEADEFDIIKYFGNLKVIIDIFSAIHLNGTIIEYHSNNKDEGFKFNNPLSRKTCGCGSSFS